MPSAIAPGMWSRLRARFIGDRKFYQTVFALIVPIIIQNTVSNVVNLLDNVMVGALGTAQMSGVAIANQLMFVFYLAVFGSISGAGIYGAQFAGARNWEGFRQTFRARILVSLVITVLGVLILSQWSGSLISLYLQGEGDAGHAADMLRYGKDYLLIMLWGLLPFAFTQCYSGALRESGETLLPMASSLTAVGVNFVFNYLLIFGKFGFPALGVRGAAIATVLSRFVEFAIVSLFSHAHRDRYPFMAGVYRSLHIQKDLAKGIAAKGIPLLVNEFLWSLGMITITQIFSTRGLIVVAGLNIASTVGNLFNVFFISMGTAVAVMTGQALGADDPDLAKKQIWRFISFSVSVCLVLGAALAISAGPITQIYNTETEVRRLAVLFMRTNAMYMAFHAIAHCCYFAIRSGGKTLITMLFDSVYSWVIVVPYTYFLVNFTAIGIRTLYPLCHLTDLLKAILGIVVVSTGFWARNLVDQEQTKPSPTDI
ncbi:MAG: MATE family efflux transporter [Bacillota bacterium]|jgi:putative MATE family efflux protein